MPATAATTPPQDMRSPIGRAALIILGLTLVDKVLALLKEMLLAAQFGIGRDLDTFNLAYAIPGLIGLLLDGAVVSSFVPLAADWRRDHTPAQVRDRTMTVLIACLAVSGLISCCGILLAPIFFPLLGYGFDPGQTALGIRMEQRLMLLVALEGTSALLAGLLRSWKAFAAVTAAQLPINCCLILFLYLGGGTIDILVQGTLLGTLGKFLWLTVAVSRRFSLVAPFRFDSPALRGFVILAIPLVGSDLIANSNILVDQSMATQLAPGGVSILRYAYRINDLPLQLAVIAISRAILPFISDQASAGDLPGLRRVFGQSLATLGVIALPVIALVMLFADEIVSVLLQRGAFTAADAHLTAGTLRCYTAGLFFFAYAFVNGEFFCVLKRTRFLLGMGFLTLALNIGLNLLFLHLTHQVEGIALSSTVTGALVTLIFLSQLSRTLVLDRPLRLAAGLFPPAVAAFAATLPCLLARGPLTASGLPTLVRLALGAGLFAIVFVPVQILLQLRTAEAHQPLWDVRKLGCLWRRGRRGSPDGL